MKLYPKYFYIVIFSIILMTFVSGSSMGANDYTGIIIGSVVYKTTNQPAPNIKVYALSGNTIGGSAITDENGNYIMEDVNSGKYKVKIEPDVSSVYLEQYYDNQSTKATAQYVEVESGKIIRDINFQLIVGGKINGKALSIDNNQPVSGLKVKAISDNGFLRYAYTQPDGTFSIVGLPTDQYYVVVEPDWGSEYVKTYYNDVFTQREAKLVSVAQEEIKSGIDFKVRIGGKILGRVTRDVNGVPEPSDPPISGIKVVATNDGILNYGYTDSNGNYVITGLPASRAANGTTSEITYVVYVDPPKSSGYAREYYNNIYNEKDAQKVEVTEGDETKGIDFGLTISGSLSGTVVRASDDMPIANMTVVAESVNGAKSSATTNEMGEYSIYGLPADNYKVYISPSSGSGYFKQYYYNVSDEILVTLVTVKENANTGYINFNVTQGARISGRVILDSTFAVGASGTSVYYGGSQWNKLETNQTNALNSIWGVNVSNLFAVGSSGTIMHYDSNNWTSMQNTDTHNLNGVWGTEPEHVYAVGDNGTILFYNGNPSKLWQNMKGLTGENVTTQNLNAVWGNNSSDVYAVGKSGTILHFDGLVWSDLKTVEETDQNKNQDISVVTGNLNSVWGIDGHVYIAGDNGNIFHFNKVNWTQMSTGYTQTLNGIWAANKDDIFAVGQGGIILHYNGNMWSKQDNGITETLNSVWGTHAGNVFAVGNNGTRLLYDGQSWKSIKNSNNDSISQNLYSVASSGVANIIVTAESRTTGEKITTKTDSTGNYTLIGLTDDNYVVYATPVATTNLFKKYYYSPDDLNPVTMPDGNSATPLSVNIVDASLFNQICGCTLFSGIDISLKSGGVIRGIVLDANSCVTGNIKPVAGIKITAQSATDEKEDKYGYTAQDGTYIIFGLNSGRYKIHAEPPGQSDYLAQDLVNEPLTDADGYLNIEENHIYENIGFCLLAGAKITGRVSHSLKFAVGSSGTFLRQANDNWSVQAQLTSDNMYGIWGYTDRDLFSVGENGTIYRFDGFSWTEMSSTTTKTLYAVWGTGTDNIFVVGADGTILHYDGYNWIAQVSPTTENLRGIWGTSDSNIFVVGDGGTILHYNGIAWSKMNSGSTMNLYSIWGNGDSEVFAVGQDGTILAYQHTGDVTDCLEGGQTGCWQISNSHTTLTLRDIWGYNGNDIFAVGDAGIILQYNGNQWAPMQSPTSNTLYSVMGSGISDIVAVGEAGTIVRCTTGSTWTDTSLGTPVALYAVDAIAIQKVTVKATSMDGTEVRYTTTDANGYYTINGLEDDTYSVVVDPKTSSGFLPETYHFWILTPRYIKATVGETVSGVDLELHTGGIISGQTYFKSVFSVGSDGAVLQFDGQQWSKTLADTNSDINGMWLYDPNNIYAVGKSGYISHFDGLSWKAMKTNITNTLNGIWGIDTTSIFAVGSNGAILNYRGTGEWIGMNSGKTDDLNGIWGTSFINVFAVGDQGLLLHFNGNSWATVDLNISDNFNAVWGCASSDLFIVGDDGKIVHYKGSNWADMYSGTSVDLHCVWGTGPKDIYAVGDSGVITHYNGTSWLSMESYTTQNLHGIWGHSSTDIYATGDAGTVLHYDGNSWTPLNSLAFGTTNLYAVGSNGSSKMRVVATSLTTGDYKYAETEADGSYVISNLVAGEYRVEFTPYRNYDFIKEYYNDTRNIGEATPVVVNTEEITSNIDFSVSNGGKITGTIKTEALEETEASVPISGIKVEAIQSGKTIASGVTDENGVYLIKGLSSGNYYVRIRPEQKSGYFELYYNGQFSVNTANLVNVSEEKVTSNIDFAVPTGGVISGRVTRFDSGNPPMSGVKVEAIPVSGGNTVSATTDANGYYAIGGLNDGNYWIKVSPANASGCKPEYYNNADSTTDAQSILVTLGVVNPVSYNFVIETDGTDRDGDGTPDCYDGCPSDSNKTSPGTCGCGIKDIDSDSDNVPDCQDLFPTDPSEQYDTDMDGIGNNADLDDDNDGMSDAFEIMYGLNPLDKTDANKDLDGDGILNKNDRFPNDPTEWIDSDNDGIGNSADLDDDNDGMPDDFETYFGLDPFHNDANGDMDHDGVLNINDGIPNDPNEIADTDHDRIGNKADTDDDGDGMPDAYEIDYGLNPLDSSDASADLDGDGISNIEEYLNGSDPTNPGPYKPVISYPSDHATGITLTPQIQVQPFSHQKSGYYHKGTQWQISTDSTFTYLVLNIKNDTDEIVAKLNNLSEKKRQNLSTQDIDVVKNEFITQLKIPDGILTPNTTYYMRMRFYDNTNSMSGWSDVRMFSTGSATNDTNANGIPDAQEVEANVDMDRDGTNDPIQTGIKSVKSNDSSYRFGVKVMTAYTTIESLQWVDEDSISDQLDRPEDMPMGLLGFRLTVDNPGDIATVTIYLSSNAPSYAKWYKYDPHNGWQDYTQWPNSSYAQFSVDRRSVTVKLKDGGYGDADGVANGIIVDPSGLVLGEAPASGSADDGGSGCFLKSLLK